MKPEYEEFYALHLDEFVKLRADFRCERCGRRPKKHHWFFFTHRQFYAGDIRGSFSYDDKVKLAVHHKDGNPMNNRLSNLICLCERCHLFAERQNRRYPQVSLLRWIVFPYQYSEKDNGVAVRKQP